MRRDKQAPVRRVTSGNIINWKKDSPFLENYTTGEAILIIERDLKARVDALCYYSGAGYGPGSIAGEVDAATTDFIRKLPSPFCYLTAIFTPVPGGTIQVKLVLPPIYQK